MKTKPPGTIVPEGSRRTAAFSRGSVQGRLRAPLRGAAPTRRGKAKRAARLSGPGRAGSGLSCLPLKPTIHIPPMPGAVG